MHEPTIVTLTRYPDMFWQFYDSMERHEPEVQKIAVMDSTNLIRDIRGCERKATWTWTIIEGPAPFVFARNFNLGVRICKGDVLFVGDDVRFLGPTLEKLKTIAYANHTSEVETLPADDILAMANALADITGGVRYTKPIGIVSPIIAGPYGGNPLQGYASWLPPPPGDAWGLYRISEQRLAFNCVYICREVFDVIGYMDESLTGYGCDDDDFCRRAQRAGFLLAVAPGVTVLHGSEFSYSPTYRRALGDEEYRQAALDNERRYREKWGEGTKTEGWAK